MNRLLFLIFLFLPTFLFAQIFHLYPENRLVGSGSENELLLKIVVCPQDIGNQIEKVVFNLNSSDSLFTKLSIYSTPQNVRFDGRKVSEYLLVSEIYPDSQFVTSPINLSVANDTFNLWVVGNVSATAPEGAKLYCALHSYTTQEGDFLLSNSTSYACREVVLSRTVLYRPGDYNSLFYRIPALITTDEGTLVVATDKRKRSNNDLPADIDILCNISHDNGKTWSAPIPIVVGDSLFGYGDCALVRGNGKNELIAAFVGGVGLWNSTAEKPMHSYIARSSDNGKSWSQPIDITNFIFGKNCKDSIRSTWFSSFFASGNGLQTSSGRLMFVAAVRENQAYSLNNYLVYSDDNGVTWQLSQCAAVGGDEAKVVELDDGTILMSVRYANYRRYTLSKDGGVTWNPTLSIWDDLEAPACNGDIIRLSSVAYDKGKNRLLHSLPSGDKRHNVSVYLSYDEGNSWPVGRCVVPCNAAYSSLCVLPDNTIGLYVEETTENSDVYEMVFYNFSLEWLTNGKDSLK